MVAATDGHPGTMEMNSGRCANEIRLCLCWCPSVKETW